MLNVVVVSVIMPSVMALNIQIKKKLSTTVTNATRRLTLCWVTLKLSVPFMYIILSVIELNVIELSVLRPQQVF